MNNLFYIYSVLYFYSCVFALGVWYTAFLSNHTSFNHRGVVVFLVCIHLRSIDLRRICEKRSSTEKPRWQDAGQLFTFSLRLLTTEKLSCASHDDLHGDNIIIIFAKQLKCTRILFSLYHKINETTFFSFCNLTDKRWPSAMQVRRNYFRSWRWGKIMNKKIAKVEEKECPWMLIKRIALGRMRRKKSLSGRGSSDVGRVAHVNSFIRTQLNVKADF